MGTAIIVIIIILVIVVILALIGMSSYNGFVKSRNLIQESWRQIDVELNRRYELIPNLVETVRAYAAHERNTLEDVTRLRSQAQQLSQSEGSLPSQERADVEAALSGAVRNLIVSVEAYPDLKSNQNFLELQRQLAETEDRIAAGRRFYNANVRVYNTKVESVPTNIIANVFKFEKATYFQVDEPAVRQAPDVNFGEIAYRGDPDQRQLPPQQAAPPVQFDTAKRRAAQSAGVSAATSEQSATAAGWRSGTAARRLRAAGDWTTESEPAVVSPGSGDMPAEMTYQQLGLSGLTVSTVGLGCNNFGARMADEDVPAVVNAAIDAGITLFDTADVYGNAGGSEILLGEALGSRRGEVIIATKFGSDMRGANGPDWGARGSRRYIRIAVENSLRRLGTDWIDLYQLHEPDPNTPIEETLAALTEIVAEGKVRYIGSSNLAGWQVIDADWTSRTSGFEAFISAQNEYSWLNRSAETELVPALEHTGQSLLPYFPLASGLLTGKYHRGQPAPAGSRLARNQRSARQGELRSDRGHRGVRGGTWSLHASGRAWRSGGHADRWFGHCGRHLRRAGEAERHRWTLGAERRRS